MGGNIDREILTPSRSFESEATKVAGIHGMAIVQITARFQYAVIARESPIKRVQGESGVNAAPKLIRTSSEIEQRWRRLTSF